MSADGGKGRVRNRNRALRLAAGLSQQELAGRVGATRQTINAIAARVCTECGTNYSVADQSGASGVCANCGAKVVQRDDDTEAAVRKRLDIYASQTLAAVRWFGEQGFLVTVDGVGDPDEIADALAAAIDARL